MGKPYHHVVGSRFVPNDLGLVRYHLRSMVERKQSSVGITTMDVYQAEPWLLPHVSNPLFKKKEWYYVFPKTKKPSRSVLGRGGSKVGCWRSGVKKIDIKDGNKIIGYKKPLTYHTIVHGEKKKTDWLMTEYSLHKVGDGFQDLVLCLIRDKTKTKVDKRINHVPQTQTQPRPHSQYQLQPQPQPQVAAENTNNILPNQLVHKEADFTGFAEELETIMLEGQEDPEATEQQQEDEIPQILDNNNNVMMSNQQVQKEADLTGFADELETIMLEGQEDRDINEQQQQEEIPMIPVAQIHENNKNVMMSNQQVQEEAADLTCFADELETIILEGDGLDATEQVQEDAGLAGLSNELDMLMQQQQIYEETQSGNNEVIPTPPPMQNNNNNKSDIIMRLGGQEERELTQQQQKQLEEVLPIPPPMHNNNNKNDDVMMKWRQELSDIEELLMKDNEGEDVTEQEERFQLLVQPIYQAQEWSQLVGDQENDTMMIIDNPNNAQALGNFEFIDVAT